MNNILYLSAALVGFGATALLGWWMIPFLHRLKFGQTIREIGPSWHKKKEGTPTMGGLMFIAGVVLAVCGCMPVFYHQARAETPLMTVRLFGGLAMAVGYGAIGFMDDYIGVAKSATWA